MQGKDCIVSSMELKAKELMREILSEASQQRRQSKETLSGDDYYYYYYYFDPLLGRPISPSPHLGSLIEENATYDDYEEAFVAILTRFSLDISPLLAQSTTNSKAGDSIDADWATLLFQYELLLSSLLDQVIVVTTARNGDDIETSTNEQHQQKKKQIVKAVYSIAQDIFQFIDITITSSRTTLVVFLLRCMQHAIHLFHYLTAKASRKQNMPSSENNNDDETKDVTCIGLLVAFTFLPPDARFQDNTTITTVAAQTHQAAYLDAQQLYPSLHLHLSLSHALNTYYYPCIYNQQQRDLGATLHHNQIIFDKPVIDTHSNKIDLPWAESAVVRRCAFSLAQLCVASPNEGTCPTEDHDCPNTTSCLLKQFMAVHKKNSPMLETLARQCRSLFFGRLLFTNQPKEQHQSIITTTDTSQNIRERHPSGIYVQPTKTTSSATANTLEYDRVASEPEWHSRPSRVVAPLRILSIMVCNTSHSSSTTILNDTLPIVYSLLDHYDAKYLTLGGALLSCVLPTVTMDTCSSDASSRAQSQHYQMSEHVLSLAIRSCRDPIALAVMAMARSKLILLRVLFQAPNSNNDDAKIGKTRTPATKVVTTTTRVGNAFDGNKSSQYSSHVQHIQTVCRELLHIVQHTYLGLSFSNNIANDNSLKSNNSHDIGRRMLPAIFVGAIIPLLSHLATWNSENANAVEIGRAGLSVFLPALMEYTPQGSVVRSENKTESVTKNNVVDEDDTDAVRIISTLVALVSLMMGSWPVVTRCSGQIMCSIMTVIGRAERHSDSDDASFVQHVQDKIVSEFAKHAAAVALVICGEAAQDVLSTVEKECVAGMTRSCEEIRLEARTLLESEKF